MKTQTSKSAVGKKKSKTRPQSKGRKRASVNSGWSDPEEAADHFNGWLEPRRQ